MRYLVALTLALAACDSVSISSSSGEVYDFCVRRLSVYCECGDYTDNANDPTAACDILADEERLFNVCGEYDLRRCDPEDDRWDPDGCNDVRQANDDAVIYTELGVCNLNEYERICPGPDLTYEEWQEAREEVAAACAE